MKNKMTDILHFVKNTLNWKMNHARHKTCSCTRRHILYVIRIQYAVDFFKIVSQKSVRKITPMIIFPKAVKRNPRMLLSINNPL
jgi:hypothetical protein